MGGVGEGGYIDDYEGFGKLIGGGGGGEGENGCWCGVGTGAGDY
jgi:hypothetical protein